MRLGPDPGRAERQGRLRLPIGEGQEDLESDLAALFPHARLVANEAIAQTDLAKVSRFSPLASPRAAAGACAANLVALAVPGHRVVRSNSDLGGYRWGIERKREMISRESRA